MIDAHGLVIHEQYDDHGVRAIAPGAFPDETRALRARYGALPVICAGMVSSALGWAELPYVPLPGTLSQLAAAAHWVEGEQTAIITGMSCIANGRADVMRGEDVQFLGAVAAALVPPDALVCQPGTHCKWAVFASGHLVAFVTAMTGEMFAMLGNFSLLAPLSADHIRADAAFCAGVERAAAADLLADIFEIRAASLLGTHRKDDNAAYLSGLLIGSDVRNRIGHGRREVHVLADGALGKLYGTAIEMQGIEPRLVDSRAAFVAGITRIWEMM